MKLIIISLLFSISVFAQDYKIISSSGSVKAQLNGSEEWVDVSKDIVITANSILFADENAWVKLKGPSGDFLLRGPAAISAGHIKTMSLDDLLLALAMNEIMNAPRDKKDKNRSGNTAVYGTKEGEEVNLPLSVKEFGLIRLSGAKQLSENGYMESAIVSAKETYRKYPPTQNNIEYRLYFANLFELKRLYEEAYNEYNEIGKLQLNDEQRKNVDKKLKFLGRKLLNK